MSNILRLETNARMSQIVVHENTVYLSGQVALNAPGAPVAEQAHDILTSIDRLLAQVDTDKSKLLSATIWLANIADFAEMNTVWDDWVALGATPARACVEGCLAAPQFTVEIAVIAAR